MVTTSIECRAEGGAQVSSPTLALPATVAPGFGATTCLQVDLTCSGESVVAFGSTGQGGDGNVYFGLRIPASDAPGTYPLTSDSERFRPGLATDGVSYTGDLTVTSGTLVVTRNDAAHFAATFAVELETTDGLHRVSLSNGAISVGFCTRVTRSGCWAAN
jgi:hypothetical protein